MPSAVLRLMGRREPDLPEPSCAQLLLLQELELSASLAGGELCTLLTPTLQLPCTWPGLLLCFVVGGRCCWPGVMETGSLPNENRQLCVGQLPLGTAACPLQ